MGLLFNESPKYLLTSESVTEGHPDKLCDQISDAILDAVMKDDPMGRVACETAVTNGLVVVLGEITTTAYVDVPGIVRETLRKAGYVNAEYGIDAKSCGVAVAIQEQSADINAGVNRALEVRDQTQDDGQHQDLDMIGAGDQGMMVGFACNETSELMPLPLSLAHKLCQRLDQVRRDGIIPYLRPDGKSQVTVEYSYGVPKRIHTVVLSAQHAPEVDLDVLTRDITEQVIQEVVPAQLRDKDTKYYVNPSGRFAIGGPMADTGLTGRKILGDTYGGLARHGGGAFSGKDPTKVDRSASYMARHIAKNLVASGAMDKCEIQLAYAIGVADPVSILVDDFGAGRVDLDRANKAVREVFPLKPREIIEYLKLRRPIFRKTSVYGHFGRNEPEFTWEQTNRTDDLKTALGI